MLCLAQYSRKPLTHSTAYAMLRGMLQTSDEEQRSSPCSKNDVRKCQRRSFVLESIALGEEGLVEIASVNQSESPRHNIEPSSIDDSIKLDFVITCLAAFLGDAIKRVCLDVE